MLRNAHRMALALAAGALPAADQGRVDLAAAPRRALVTTLQLAIVTATLAPVLVVTQPFLPVGPAAALAALVLVGLGVSFWRGAANLHGHVRAGAQVIVEALSQHARGPAPDETDALTQLREVLPGLGEPVAVTLGEAVRRAGADPLGAQPARRDRRHGAGHLARGGRRHGAERQRGAARGGRAGGRGDRGGD